MRHLLSFVGLSLFAFHTWAQTSTVVPGQFLESSYPTFSSESIAASGIRSITVRLMRKPSGRTIYDDGRRLMYRFDESGDLTSFKKVNPGPYGSTDTVITLWIKVNGRLHTMFEKVGGYQRKVEYEHIHDSLSYETISVKRGDLDWQVLSKEKIALSLKKVAGRTIKVELRGGLDSKPYQRTIRTYQNGNITGEEQWVGARIRYVDEWHYRNGRVAEYVHRDEEQGRKFQVTYGTDDALQDEGDWCIEDVCRSWSMVYYPDGLPKGWIIIDPESQDLEIWEFRYGYD